MNEQKQWATHVAVQRRALAQLCLASTSDQQGEKSQLQRKESGRLSDSRALQQNSTQ